MSEAIVDIVNNKDKGTSTITLSCGCGTKYDITVSDYPHVNEREGFWAEGTNIEVKQLKGETK